MSITAGDTVNVNGTVTEVVTDSVTVSLEEIYLDSQWRKFETAKSLTVATSDYNTDLTDQELALVKVLAEANKTSTALSEDQRVLAASIIAKLSS
jgi:hypothetical protein